MNHCGNRSAQLLPEYIHGLLEPEERELVADHLEDCRECALELMALRQLEDQVIPEPPPWFYSSLPGKVTAQAGRHRKRKARVLIPVWAGSLAAVVVAALLLIHPDSTPPEQVDLAEYAMVEIPTAVPTGLEEEILAVSGTFMDGLDQSLVHDLEKVSDEYLAGEDIVGEGTLYALTDEETIRAFEDLVEQMTPERVRKRVMS